MHQLFISYSRKDTEFARKLTEHLEAEGLDAWVDWQDIPPSVDWMDEIKQGIEAADIFVFLVSPDSLVSEVCEAELAHGILNGKRIIPVIVREVEVQSVPASISHLNWIFFSRPQDVFEDAFEKLMTAIKTDFDWVQVHRRLQVKALEWERNNQEDSFLLRGKDLETAEAQLTVNVEKSPFPTQLQKLYVETSHQVDDRLLEQQQAKEQQLQVEKTVGARSRRLTYILMAVFTIAFGVLYFWLFNLVTDISLRSLRNQIVELIETSSVGIDGSQIQTLIDKYPEGSAQVTSDAYFTSLESMLTNILHTNTKVDPHSSLYIITKGQQAQDILVVASANGEFKFKETRSLASQNTAQIQGMQSTSNDFELTNFSVGSERTRISACTPILNSQSVSIGALCADFPVGIVHDAQNTVIKTLGIAFLAVYPIMLVIVFFVTRSLAKRSSSAKSPQQ